MVVIGVALWVGLELYWKKHPKAQKAAVLADGTAETKNEENEDVVPEENAAETAEAATEDRVAEVPDKSEETNE